MLMIIIEYWFVYDELSWQQWAMLLNSCIQTPWSQAIFWLWDSFFFPWWASYLFFQFLVYHIVWKNFARLISQEILSSIFATWSSIVIPMEPMSLCCRSRHVQHWQYEPDLRTHFKCKEGKLHGYQVSTLQIKAACRSATLTCHVDE